MKGILWSKDEIDRLKLFYQKNSDIRSISRDLKRGYTSVLIKLKELDICNPKGPAWHTYAYNAIDELTNLNTIVRLYCGKHKISLAEICEKTRRRSVLLHRQVLHSLVAEYTKNSFATIGKKIGGLDHATVLNSLKTTSELREVDKKFFDEYYEIADLYLHPVVDKSGETVEEFLSSRLLWNDDGTIFSPMDEVVSFCKMIVKQKCIEQKSNCLIDFSKDGRICDILNARIPKI